MNCFEQKVVILPADFTFTSNLTITKLTNWKGVFIMTEEQETEVQRLIKDIDEI